MKKRSLFWIRRDIRLQDNAGMFKALSDSDSVACLFVFDKNILSELGKFDKRVDFIWHCVKNLKDELRALGSDLIVVYDKPEEVIPVLSKKYKVNAVYCNDDYEPNARQRDGIIEDLLAKSEVEFIKVKDHAIFDKEEILNSSGQAYTVFTTYANAWKKKFSKTLIESFPSEGLTHKFAKFKSQEMIDLSLMGFKETDIKNIKIGFSNNEANELLNGFIDKRIKSYNTARNFPSVSGVSYLSVHNRFGTISVRNLIREALNHKERDTSSSEGVDSWINELIWRDFYFQIIYNFPHVAYEPFHKEYINFPWENDMEKFQKWCEGETGYPLVDAAMKQLNKTGYMHNRLRMVVASFLTKHLLVDYRFGEQYFAAKLLDFDLSANNGGWQWAASTGCDAQPYFRIFNPILQSEKFDPQGKFIKKMLPIFSLIDNKYIHNPSDFKKELKMVGVNIGVEYPSQIVNHKAARQNTLNLFKEYFKIID
jgi:deoxyribodipyrimidine photo-lyase